MTNKDEQVRRAIATAFHCSLERYSMIEFRRDKHRFFDDLLTMLNSMSSLAAAMECVINEPSLSRIFIDSSYPIAIYSVIEKKGLEFHPYALLKIMSGNDKWPARFVEFTEVPYYDGSLEQLNPGAFALSSSSFFHTIELITQSAFIRYYETLVPEVEDKFGSDPQRWPSVWNFARVIRNAFAHGGKIYFQKPISPIVSWKTQTYSPSDNGRQIMGKDISHGDIILLMAEMDAAI